jgi:hypothetical protein
VLVIIVEEFQYLEDEEKAQAKKAVTPVLHHTFSMLGELCVTRIQHTHTLQEKEHERMSEQVAQENIQKVTCWGVFEKQHDMTHS